MNRFFNKHGASTKKYVGMAGSHRPRPRQIQVSIPAFATQSQRRLQTLMASPKSDRLPIINPFEAA